MSDKNNDKMEMCMEYCKDKKRGRRNMGGGGGGAFYVLGFIGALVYFIQNADGFWVGVLGILQAIIWPVLLIYKALEALF